MHHIFHYRNAAQEVAKMIEDTVAFRLDQFQNVFSVRIVVFRTAAEVHIIVHLFSDTLVSIERMKLPSFVELNAQLAYQ